MKLKISLFLVTVLAGIFFTFFILNDSNIYAKEEYSVFAFQSGAFKDYDNALKESRKSPSSIIVNVDNLYKVYVAIYKDVDLVNKMLVYFEDNNINIYLKNILVNKDVYENLIKYEEILKKSKDEKVYNKVNQSLLDLYIESI